jgi:hypothetical protein
VFAFTVTALPPVAAGKEVDDVPEVPALTEIDGGVTLDSPLAPVLASPFALETTLPVPFASVAVAVPTLADESVSDVAPTVGLLVVAVTEVETDEGQPFVVAPANGSCPPRAIAVAAPANENAATEAIIVVRNDFIGTPSSDSVRPKPSPLTSRIHDCLSLRFLSLRNSKGVAMQ